MSPKWLRKEGYASINGPPGNCYKRHVRGGQNGGSTTYCFSCLLIWVSILYSTCLDLMCVSLPSSWRFSLLLLEFFFRFQFPYTMLITSFPCIFLRLASPSQLGFLLLFLHIHYISHSIILRFIIRLLDSFMPSSYDNCSILDKSSSTPLPSMMIFPSIVVHFLLGSSFLNCWSMLDLRQALQKGSRLLIPYWMRVHEPNTTTMYMVAWLLIFLMAPRMLHQHNRLFRKHMQRMTRSVP